MLKLSRSRNLQIFLVKVTFLKKNSTSRTVFVVVFFIFIFILILSSLLVSGTQKILGCGIYSGLLFSDAVRGFLPLHQRIKRQ